MSATTCEQFSAQVHELVDGRLSPDLAARMHAHASACERCGQLLASDQQLVASLGALPALRAPDDADRRLSEGLEAWERRQRRLTGLRWMSNAALLLMGLGLGLAVGLPRGAQLKSGAPASPHAVRSVPDRDKGLDIQLARHVRSTEGLYQQVLQLKSDKLARSLLDAELRLSGLKSSTPDLKRRLEHAAGKQIDVEAYLAEANTLVELIHHWLHHENLSLKEVQARLRRSDLPKQIAALKQKLVPSEELPAGLPQDPALMLYLRARQHLHLGQPGWALTYMQQFVQRFPRHELSQGWKRAIPEHDHVHPEDDPDQLPAAPVEGAVKAVLMLDDECFDLESGKAIKQFHALWQLSVKKGLLLEAGVHRYKAEDGKLYRQVELTWHSGARRDKQMVAQVDAFLKLCGLHRHDPGVFPRELSLVARDGEFPGPVFPGK